MFTEVSYPVTTVDDAYAACDPEAPLEPGDPRWVDLNSVRGIADLATRVTRRIARTRPGLFHKQLITGHRGSGKSTEIKRLQSLLQESNYYAVYFDAFDVLDPQDIEYVDVLLGIARVVYERLQDTEITVSPQLLQSLESWFNETFVTEENRHDFEVSLKAEAGIEAKIPAFLRLMTTLTGVLRAGGQRRHEVREKLERELRVFLLRLNDLLDDVQVRLTEVGWRGLVVLVDNLEKMPIQARDGGQNSHSTLFVHHAEQLKAPRCHIVYTVPVALVFNANLGADYNDIDLIPMVKVTESDGMTPNAIGRQALYEVIARRLDVAQIFDAPGDVERLATWSGGVVRDLMRLVRFACDDAEDRIITAHVDNAWRGLVREYDYLVQDDDLDRLATIARTHVVDGNETSGWLLNQRLVLEYRNHERWYDLHPAVRAGRRVSERLEGR